MTTHSLFPLIRHISHRVSPLLIVMPVSANLVTTASLLVGLCACWYLTKGTYEDTLIGALLFLICYILDNSDGEIARAKNQCTTFGKHYDTFVDWVVHTGFFACLGWGIAQSAGQTTWLWLGLSAAAGGRINYFVGLFLDFRRNAQIRDDIGLSDVPGQQTAVPQSPAQWAIFILRELSRADFCFIVLVLALFDQMWLLLPAAAIGAQVYWITQFVDGVREYHA